MAFYRGKRYASTLKGQQRKDFLREYNKIYREQKGKTGRGNVELPYRDLLRKYGVGEERRERAWKRAQRTGTQYGKRVLPKSVRSGVGGALAGAGYSAEGFPGQLDRLYGMFQQTQGQVPTELPTELLTGQLAAKARGGADIQGAKERMQRQGITPGSSRWNRTLERLERGRSADVMGAATQAKLTGAEFAQRGRLGQLGALGQFAGATAGPSASYYGNLANIAQQQRAFDINRADIQAQMQARPANIAQWQATQFGLSPRYSPAPGTAGLGKTKKRKDPYASYLKKIGGLG